MKRILSIGLVLVLAVSVIFADNSPSYWAVDEVDSAREKNLVIPETNEDFQSNISRKVFCKLIVNMVEKTTKKKIIPGIANPFIDVDDGDVLIAYHLGIVKGTSATTFRPERNITRQEIATMMMRAARVLDSMRETSYAKNIDTSGITFADESEIADWAITDVKEMHKLGLMKGVGNNKIAPLRPTSIEQSILLTLRLFEKVTSLYISPKPVLPPIVPKPIPFPDLSFGFKVNEGESIEIPIKTFSSDLSSAAVITDVTSPPYPHELIIREDGKAVIYNAEYLNKTVTHSMSVKIKDGNKTRDIDFKIIVENVPGVKGKKNLLLAVNEGTTITLPIYRLFDDYSPEARIMFVSAPLPQIVITPSLLAVEYTGEDVTRNVTNDVSATLVDGGKQVVCEFKIFVRELGNFPPKKMFSGPSFKKVLHIGKSKGDIEFKELVIDVDDDDAITVEKIEPQDMPNPKNFYCVVKEKIINNNPPQIPIKVHYLEVGVNGTGATGTSDTMGFEVTFTDGTDTKTVTILVEKKW